MQREMYLFLYGNLYPLTRALLRVTRLPQGPSNQGAQRTR